MFYPESERYSKGALILASMSPDMVADIIATVQAKGASLKDDLYGPESIGTLGGTARFMGWFSNSYISYADFDKVWTGFSVLVLDAFRNPKIANDNYKSVLQGAYSLPESMAEAISKQIETEDIIGAGKELGMWSTMLAKFKEGVRETLNWGAGLINMPWEVDQTQAYDVDFLYELSLLGEAADKLTSRFRLMTAQVAIQKNLGILTMGDIEGGDVEIADAYVGDVFRRLTARSVPPAIMGGAAPLLMAGQKATKTEAAQVMRDAGYKTNAQDQVVAGPAKTPAFKQAIDKMINMKPSTAMLIGAGLGLTPIAIKAIASRIGKGRGDVMGDVDGDAYSTIATHYGPEAGDLWAAGDVEGLFGHIAELADEDVSTGDPDLDLEIMGEVEADDAYGDTEVGGVFRRARANRLMKQARRIKRRTQKKMGKQNLKDRERARIEEARNAKAHASDWNQDVNNTDVADDQGQNDEYAETQDSSGNSDLPSVDDFE